MTEIFMKRDMPKIMAIIASFFGNLAEDKKYELEIREHRKKRSVDGWWKNPLRV